MFQSRRARIRLQHRSDVDGADGVGEAEADYQPQALEKCPMRML